MSVSLAKKWRHALEAVLVRGVAWGVPRLPRRGVLALAKVAGRAAYLADARGRKTGRENLRVVFPEKEQAWRDAVLVRSYQSFARTMLDLFWAPNLDAQSIQRWNILAPDSPETEAHAAAQGALWCTPHYGNFEWIALSMGWRGFPMMVVAQDFKNAALTPIFARLRGLSGHTAISSAGAMLRLFKNLKRGGHSSFLCDLTIKPSQAATVIRCFGLKMSATILHAALVERTGLPVIPMLSVPQEDGTYAVRMWPAQHFPPGTPHADIAQRIWDLFEPAIREQPEHWLWMYKHWRYLPADAEGRAYPSYANRSKKFDKLEASLSVPAMLR